MLVKVACCSANSATLLTCASIVARALLKSTEDLEDAFAASIACCASCGILSIAVVSPVSAFLIAFEKPAEVFVSPSVC